MEHVRQKSLKTEFFTAVSVTLLTVVLASAVTVWGCLRFQKWLVPDTNYVMINVAYRTPDGMEEQGATRVEIDGGEQKISYLKIAENGVPAAETIDPSGLTLSVESLDYGIGWKGPRRKLAYIMAGAAMGLLPAAYSATGFFLCALRFYRRRLAPGITGLDEATRHISDGDLDFTVDCSLENELGRLCRSFEEMRRTLKETYQELWKIIEEKKLIQASIAHDLRNPIAIIEGYTEYLQLHLQSGDLTPQETLEIASRIDSAAKRLERYTESVREISQLDDIEIAPLQISAEELIPDLTADLTLMAKESGKILRTTGQNLSGSLSIDAPILYRILENILNNALRLATKEIQLSFSLTGRQLVVSVADDGCGFPEEILQGRNRLLMPAAGENGHCGMGLTISRILCQKHGGWLELRNREPHGAEVKIFLEV